jgi:hypothetical protein
MPKAYMFTETIQKGRNTMEKNVGGLDKTIRIIIGIVLLIVGIFVPLGTGLRITSFVVAAIALGTAFVGF